ncbi:hypothetical protein GOV05_02945 [Candidatus Woesearchaeota archaeon]|nr:hypothetical protein [Candidatus Woesearchaeota archaeon]
MGAYFDNFQTILDNFLDNNEFMSNGEHAWDYLSSVKAECKHYELSLNYEDIGREVESRGENYPLFLFSFLKDSQEQKTPLITPSRVTAIENREVLSIVDIVNKDSFILTSLGRWIHPGITNPKGCLVLVCGEVNMEDVNANKFNPRTNNYFDAVLNDDDRYIPSSDDETHRNFIFNALLQDAAHIIPKSAYLRKVLEGYAHETIH